MNKMVKNFNYLDFSQIPLHMVGSVKRYLNHGIKPGSFLTALFSNDLKEAMSRADDVNRIRLPDWYIFMYMQMPSDSQGSPRIMQDWLALFVDVDNKEG
jgi:hypothetical protein